MEVKSVTKLILSIFIIINIQVIAKWASKDLKSIDSTVQKQDTSFQKIWEIDNQTLSSTNLIVSENKIYTTTDDGLVHCYLFNGQEKWIAEVFGSIKNNAVLFKDLFLTATIEGDLYSINSNNGDVVQVIGVGENITTNLSLVDLTTSTMKSKGVVFGTEAGNIFCYDIFTFEMIWKINLSTNPIITKPVILNDKIIFKNSLKSVYCVNAKSGLLIWKYDFNEKEGSANYSNTLTNEKSIFSLSSTGEIIVLDLMVGKKLWSINAIDVLPQIVFTFDKQKLILFSKKGEIIFISSKDGKELNKIELMKPDLFSFVVEANEENIFIGFSDGSLYSIDKKNKVQQLTSQTNIPITSINIIKNDELMVKEINGKITFYKIN
jgi:outer membrane protein assembly factor BamB